MRILIDLFHPAHIHLFRRAAAILEGKGHEVFWLAHDKDILVQLLERYGCAYKVVSRARRGRLGLCGELIKHDWGLYKTYREFRPHLMLGTSLSICHISRVTQAKSIVFLEDDADIVRLYYALGYNFAHVICTPRCVRHKPRKNHLVYDGYHELAYLHPNHFKPDATVLDELGLKEKDRFFLIRLVALRAVHDVGHTGLSVDACRRVIDVLREHGRVFLNAEMALPRELQPYQIRISPERIHDVLAFATMFVGDSQTMTIEAAVLGTPAIRCNTFVGRLSVPEELEYKYALTYGFFPQDHEQMLARITDLLARDDLKQEWQRRRDKMLAEKIDVAAWIVDLVERYATNPQSVIAQRDGSTEVQYLG